jgi:hypothetical protein
MARDLNKKHLTVLHEPPSLSKSALLMSPCLAWAGPSAQWFDETRVDPEDFEARNNGTQVHGLLDELVKIPASRDWAKKWSNETIIKLYSSAADYLERSLRPRFTELRSEVAVGVNWSTGETKLLDIKDRAYPNEPGWMYGTADLVGILKTGELYVGDWKTGGTEGAEEQLLSLACVLQGLFLNTYVAMGETEVRHRDVVISCLQVNEDGVWPHERKVPFGELLTHHAIMAATKDALNVGGNPTIPGIHCTALYCPHLGHCRAIEDVVRMAADKAPEGQGPISMPGDNYTGDLPRSDKEAGESMAMVSAARRQLKYVEQGLKYYIANGGKVTMDGWEWSEGNNGFRWRRN